MKNPKIVAVVVLSIIIVAALSIIVLRLTMTIREKKSEIDGMIMVNIPAGEFAMGYKNPESAKYVANMQQPEHVVDLDDFWMDKTEVTNAMFALFVGDTHYITEVETIGNGYVATNPETYWVKTDGASWKTPRGPGSSIIGFDDHPVVQVTWGDANAYCAWAGRRLPTEAEWEKAARGTDMRMYPWGNDEPTGELANLPDINLYNFIKLDVLNNGIDDGYAFTAPVGSYPKGASPYGIVDMAGNVWEWIYDWFGEDYYKIAPLKNPAGPSTGEVHIIRGGSWDASYGDLSVNRAIDWPDGRSASLGFRCAFSSLK
jgi:formylglycine-generating enzyme required for sulfatase activity